MAVNLSLAKEKGFSFNGASVTDKTRAVSMVKDSLDPNATVPAYMRAYVTPEIIKELTAIRAYKEIAPEVKNGDFTTSFAQFRCLEYTGDVQPYGDYDGNGQSGVNTNYPTRQQYRFQTTIKVGDLEQEMNAKARVDLLEEKQTAAAINIDIAFNNFAMYGVQGMAVYGLLNEPSLNAALTPISVGGVTAWSGKTANEQMDDITKLMTSLYTQANGHINKRTATKLLVSPNMLAQMDKVNTYGITTYDMITKTYPNMTVEVVPELYDEATQTSTMMVKADQILGQQTMNFGYSDKYYAHAMVRNLSNWEQKISAGTFGAIVYRPFAIATMTGC